MIFPAKLSRCLCYFWLDVNSLPKNNVNFKNCNKIDSVLNNIKIVVKCQTFDHKLIVQ